MKWPKKLAHRGVLWAHWARLFLDHSWVKFVSNHKAFYWTKLRPKTQIQRFKISNSACTISMPVFPFSTAFHVHQSIKLLKFPGRSKTSPGNNISRSSSFELYFSVVSVVHFSIKSFSLALSQSETLERIPVHDEEQEAVEATEALCSCSRNPNHQFLVGWFSTQFVPSMFSLYLWVLVLISLISSRVWLFYYFSDSLQLVFFWVVEKM